MDKSCYVSIQNDKCAHTRYHKEMFNHRNPLLSQDDYNYYERCVERFRRLLRCNGGHKLFVTTVINMDKVTDSDRIAAIEFNNRLSKHAKNYTLLVVLNVINQPSNWHEYTRYNNIDFLEVHTVSASKGVRFDDPRDNAYLSTAIANKYNFDGVDLDALERMSKTTRMLQRLGKQCGTDKATYHQFTDLYDALFCFDRDTVSSMIEVGVHLGGSVNMWRKYFSKATIYAFDYDARCGERISSLSNVIFRCANQDSPADLQRSVSDIPLGSVDIIIDDGGHFSSQQRNTLNVFWPYLRSGGTFVIEDLHTNVKHWFPDSVAYNQNKKYWDESPTVLETVMKLQLGQPVPTSELNIPTSQIKQVILWSQPSTTSMTCVFIKA